MIENNVIEWIVSLLS